MPPEALPAASAPDLVTPGPTALTRFQQVLVSTDGTVTRILEAYAGEPVEVVKLFQAVEAPTDADGDLGLCGDDKILRRRVVLRGLRSGENLLYAEAVVVIARVAPLFVDELLGTGRPIGALLAHHRTETFREILALGREPAGACAAHFGIEAAADVIFRTYRIVAGGQPAILITERFPAASFRSLPG